MFQQVRILLLSLAGLMASAGGGWAQTQIKAPSHFNWLSPTPLGTGNPQPSTQFSSVGPTAGGRLVPIVTNGQSSEVTLQKARIGYAAATGVPLYNLGDEILPPLVDADGATFLGGTEEEIIAAARLYWRAKPVRPGETFQNPNGANLVDVDGNQMPNSSGSTGTPLPALGADAYENFYYSPHAGHVLASKAGGVVIWWVSKVPHGTGLGAWQFRRESFSVSNSASVPVRTIFWTEKAYDGPRVEVPSGRIEAVNPIYTANFPRLVTTEYEQLGVVRSPDEPDELRTLWFSLSNGSGRLSAYNREGRILVEYLGAEVSAGKREFLGGEVLEVVRNAKTQTVVVELGQEVLPFTGETGLEGSPVSSGAAGSAASYFATVTDGGGKSRYYAERENLNPDAVKFYWLEASAPGIAAGGDEGAADVTIRWPRYRNRYSFVWPEDFSRYAPVTTAPGGSDPATGLVFDTSSYPELITQDDPVGSEARLDVFSQRFIVRYNPAASYDRVNRSLLKFRSIYGDFWYQPVYSQEQGSAGYLEPDGGPALQTSATVGSRIERPSGRYALAGSILAGRCYQDAAYKDPYELGVEAAAAGAIIPVNAIPGENELTIQWFEKIETDIIGLVGFYVPSKQGRYTVSYPAEIEGWEVAAAAGVLRTGAGSVLLEDGRVLTAGGTSDLDEALDSAEVYDPVSGLWSPVSSMNVARGAGAAMTLLPGGKVLMTGGETDVPGNGTSAAEVFDPGTSTWTTVASMAQARYHHRAILLADGSVLVSGGLRAGSAQADAEVYHPKRDSWESVGNMNVARQGHQLSLAPDGNVIVTGGHDSSMAVERYNPDAKSWTTTANPLVKVRRGHTGTVLEDGRILLVGSATGTGLGNSEIYDPSNDTATLLNEPLSVASGHSATLMPNGTVLVAGGKNSVGNALAGIWVFDAGTGSWEAGPPLASARAEHAATLLDDGTLLLSGGLQGGVASATAEQMLVGDTLVMASNRGTVGLTAAQSNGTIYRENDRNAIGYNPDEEHAVKSEGIFWALRDDLNVTSGADYTSEPFVLIAFTDSDDGRPAMRAFRVLRTDSRARFDYALTAGTRVLAPMPLPVMPLPLRDGAVANTEVGGAPDTAIDGTAPPGYVNLTVRDRSGYHWVYRGPHAGGSPTFGMQWYYPMQEGFHFPGRNPQPAVGSALPYLRPLVDGQPQGDPVSGTAQTVIYRPSWPESVPTLRIAETLTVAKNGLPDVRNQKSAEILYQQSIAGDGAQSPSVILHDPTRFKMVPLAEAGLDTIPQTIRTSAYQGKTYFQGLPPHLQTRFFLDPLASARGSLVLKGEFHDEIAGDDYLDLNVLSAQEAADLKALAVNEEADVQAAWENAIDGLRTRAETFVEDPHRAGTYIVSDDPVLTRDFAVDEPAIMPGSDTARDSYALSATGLGEGYVTLFFGNGSVPALTPAGDPPVMQIIRVVPELYHGELKVILSGNPLDEKASLRHTGDFAARPENFEFEWRHAPPTNGGTQPAVYTYDNATYLGDSSSPESRKWRYILTPSAVPQPVGLYSADRWVLPTTVTINAAGHDEADPLPGILLRANEDVDFTGGIPANLTFSANLGDLDGFILYVNGSVAVVYANDVPALTRFAAGATYDLKLTRASDFAELPVEGRNLMVIAEIGDSLYFRVFDGAGVRQVDTNEAELAARSAEVATLKGVLESLWQVTNLAASEKNSVVESAASILGYELHQNAVTGLSPNGLSKQFAVSDGYFRKGLNTIEVGLYSAADAGTLSTVDFRLEGATRNDEVVAAGSPWVAATGSPEPDNRATVGGSPDAPLGSPQLVMSDNYFTVRFRARPLLADGVTANPAHALTGGAWSNWAPPALVEGWVKRLLAAINPFNQRVKDLNNNAVNTDVSLLTQAGTRWEGDIALSLDAINDYGLIEIYETVFRRAKGISIDSSSGYSSPAVNDALLLVAGYLSDLYTILGNEAFADAANPTISIGAEDSTTEVNTSRFSFEGQVASVLDEELALLRGRDDFLSPAVTQAPFYNRLFWNYTRGINSGEALYATNYNIKEKVGSSTEDGSIDAADAQRMFPQGHGDAYGHYLTSLKGYYHLLANPNFTWTPRIETLNIFGNTVAVDYQDERKFAEDAANLARSAEQVVALTFRQQYRDDPAEGWESFRDGDVNGETGVTREWGLDEWTSRSAQGAYYHWAVGNAILPDVDEVHTGIQKIDRTTVPELQLLAVATESFQTTIDNANSHLNPLGLSPGAIAMDIDPDLLRGGKSHFEQVYDRALAAELNAKGAFDQAATMTRLLRDQENTIDDFNTSLEEQEGAFNYQLIELFGRPYAGDIGPGRTYAQGYTGPDLTHWFIVDRPAGVPDYVDYSYDQGVLAEVIDYGYEGINYTPLDEVDLEPTNAAEQWLDHFTIAQDTPQLAEYPVYVNRDRFTQFSDVWRPDGSLGSRPLEGRLQEALLDAQDSWLALDGAVGNYYVANAKLQDNLRVFQEVLRMNLENRVLTGQAIDAANQLDGVIIGMDALIANLGTAGDFVIGLAQAFANGMPDSWTDILSPFKAVVESTAYIQGNILKLLANNLGIHKAWVEDAQGDLMTDLGFDVLNLDLDKEELQMAYGVSTEWRDLANSRYGIAQLAIAHQRKLQNIGNLLTEGDRVLLEREIFRKRAATVVQGYRTNDLTFRAFRNESLEQYRTLFDLASRYTYLAAKSYDYETGLLGTTAGQDVIARIVSARSLGDLSGGKPQATVSTLGDAGLAGTMAQLQAEFSVAEGRLGINNPDRNGSLFSLRHELFRLLKDPARTDDDTAWQQTLEQHFVSDLMNDPDVVAQCRNITKPDGSAVPGIIIPFGSTIEHGKNFFGLPTAAGDHNFSPSNFATKIYSVGIVLDGYIGMDPYAELTPGAGEPNTNHPQALNATPYLYLIPTGSDKLLAPPLGDTGVERAWMVQDQALPLPFNLGANAFSSTQFFSANGTLSEQPWIRRKHQAFRPVNDPAFFQGLQKSEFGSSRLIGRSVWNTQWKLVIPAYALLSDEQAGLTRFAASVRDIKLFLRTYSNSGN